jgi:peptidoglycan/LPS O-acetylase OafA/YrhL
MAVCSFFLLSGWLIGSSAERSDVLTYLANRARRLLPAFWASLAIVAAAATLLRPSLGPDAAAYLAGNATLQIRYFDIGDLTSGLPYAGAINGSLWTLQIEALCYLLILVLIRSRVALAVGVGLAWGLAMSTGLLELRFIAMFGLGAVLRNNPPQPGHLMALAAMVVLLVSGRFGMYFYVGLPALAVLVYWAANHAPYRSRDDDPSYGIYVFAFPIQQALAATGLYALGWLPFVAVSLVLSFAAGKASWRIIERPFLARNRHRRAAAVLLPQG